MQESSLLRWRCPTGAGATQAEGGIHQGDMRKRLGEVSYQSLGPGIVLFRQQAHVVGQRQHPLKELSCIGVTSLQLEGAHHPETNHGPAKLKGQIDFIV